LITPGPGASTVGASYVAAQKRQRRAMRVVLAAVGLVAVILLASLALWSQNGKQAVAPKGRAADASAENRGRPEPSGSGDRSGHVRNERSEGPGLMSAGHSGGDNEKPPTAEPPEPEPATPPEREPQPADPSSAGSLPAPPPTRPSSGPARSGKLAVPDSQKQEEVEKRIQELFAFDLASAKDDPAQKKALAEQLFTAGLLSKGGPHEQFVMMRVGCELAAEAGDLRPAIQGADEIVKRYDVDPWELKVGLVTRAITAMRERPPDTEEVGKSLAAVLDFMERAATEGHFDAAARLARNADILAAKTRDNRTINEVKVRTREIERERQRRARQ